MSTPNQTPAPTGKSTAPKTPRPTVKLTASEAATTRAFECKTSVTLIFETLNDVEGFLSDKDPDLEKFQEYVVLVRAFRHQNLALTADELVAHAKELFPYYVPQAAVRLYRGAPAGREERMAWTSSLDTARAFAGGQLLGRQQGIVWTTLAPPSALLAQLNDRQEFEYVVDPDFLEITEYKDADLED